ncbi:conserved protein of unknown function [Burkholderia multivorans]
MNELTLKAGGTLEYVRWVQDEETGDGAYLPFDVSGSAAAYAMEPVRFAGEIYVRDIFSLLERNPLLVEMFGRVYAAEYLREAQKGHAVVYTGEYDPQGIEYLELFYDWAQDEATRELGGVHRLWVAGVGYELRDDVIEDGLLHYAKGARIRWGIQFSRLAHVLDLPLRFNPEVGVADSRNLARTLHVFRVPSPTLMQVIHALLWELSWAGGPEETDAFANTLRDAIDDAEMSEPMSADAFVAMLKKMDED